MLVVKWQWKWCSNGAGSVQKSLEAAEMLDFLIRKSKLQCQQTPNNDFSSGNQPEMGTRGRSCWRGCMGGQPATRITGIGWLVVEIWGMLLPLGGAEKHHNGHRGTKNRQKSGPKRCIQPRIHPIPSLLTLLQES